MWTKWGWNEYWTMLFCLTLCVNMFFGETIPQMPIAETCLLCILSFKTSLTVRVTTGGHIPPRERKQTTFAFHINVLNFWHFKNHIASSVFFPESWSEKIVLFYKFRVDRSLCNLGAYAEICSSNILLQELYLSTSIAWIGNTGIYCLD